MLVATNRCIDESHVNGDVGSEFAFGEKLSDRGASELRFAHARKLEARWEVLLVPEPANLTAESLPSRRLFADLAARCNQNRRHCLFYVHGYGKTFVETLEQAWLLEQRYGVEVVLFSWPSNTGGFWLAEYRKARRDAQASFGALDALLEKYGSYLAQWMRGADERALRSCRSTTNLMAHSLGNYLLEHYVQSQAYQAETRLFSNVVLSQADVNSLDHPKWVDRIIAGQRVYVTVNENDKILGASEILNPPRLGKTLAHLEAKQAVYVDFTGTRGVGSKHQLWGEVRNATVTRFFDAVLKGGHGERAPGLHRDGVGNLYRTD